ncbi:50S ribosomal protein L7/L12 [Thelohanellus kitauei]|uniref:50S ribosomal protein L7/L12 n=1 Tax=Thelohanellus kitauei TaxID=669202 RepID=A0A0C2J2R0_THEKT|nr:50S ribosomal protein L7/L12 [Thelohanellus kitauei]
MAMNMAKILRMVPFRPTNFVRHTQFVPMPGEEPKKYHDKILKIVEDIGNLTVVELVEFNQCLKTRFNIPDMPTTVSVAAAPTPSARAEGPAKPTKTKFFVKLETFSAENKIKTIKLVREINPGLNLVDAKKLVEGCPSTVRENIDMDEADAIKKKFEEIGCTIILE